MVLQNSFALPCVDERMKARARAASPVARRNSSIPSTGHSAAGRRFHHRPADGRGIGNARGPDASGRCELRLHERGRV